MPLPRIFVGTLHCGEAEFEASREATLLQKNVTVTHHIISELPEYEAHNALWQAWDQARVDHDLFVKIDADTVLNRDTALSEIYDLFRLPDVTGCQILLHDFFTDDLIAGLNAFAPAVQFRASRSRLFADHADFGHKIVLKGEAVAHLAPIGFHCQVPHPYQAFHYGYHRALKKQKAVIQKVAQAWQKDPQEGRAWALAGAASVRWWRRGSSDYNSKSLRRLFAELQNDGKRNEAVLDCIRKYLS